MRLGVALTRRRSYGASHPMVAEAEQALASVLQQGLAKEAALAIGVAHRVLLIDGEPFEEGGLVAQDLAERLHRRGVGALTLHRGVTLDGVQALLAWLSQRDDAEQEPPSIPSVTVGRVAYDRLSLADGAAMQAEIDAVWHALAAAALDVGGEALVAAGSSPGTTVGTEPNQLGAGSEPLTTQAPAEVADAIRAGAGQRAYAERLGVVLGSLASRVSKAPPGVRDVIGTWLQEVITRLDASTIASIVTSIGDQRAQRRLVSAVVDVLPLAAVVQWLEVAGRANHQELSHHLLRILTKLSAHAGRPGAREWTPDAFRDAARDLVHGWELGDPNPGEHAALLDHITRLDAPSASDPRGGAGAQSMTEAELTGSALSAMRLIQMACELGDAGDDALACVDTLVAAGRARELLACLEQAPASPGVRLLRARLLSPTGLNAALRCEPFDADAARQLLAATDSVLAPALLDALEAATSRTARRLIFDRLRSEGAPLLPTLLQRLNDNPPWYFARNLLALVREIGVPDGMDLGVALTTIGAYQSHAQEQVRLEALRLLVQDPRTRDAALGRALRDPSLRVVSTAIDAILAQGSAEPTDAKSEAAPPKPLLSRELTARLMALVDDARSDEALRARAVRALAAAPGPTVRSWLLQLVSHRTRLLGRLKVATSRPAVDAALDLLADQYAHEDDVKRVLTRAGRSATRTSPGSARRITPTGARSTSAGDSR